MRTIAVAGTFDTKGPEHAFVAEIIRSLGHRALLIDFGTRGPSAVQADIPAPAICPSFSQPGDRGRCVAEMARAAPVFVSAMAARGEIHGIISLGGGGGTSIATAIMRALPLGLPKVMVSTLASGNTAPYLGISDIVMVPAIVDVSGLNAVSRRIFASAARAVCAMAAIEPPDPLRAGGQPLIVASMFGNTTGCVNAARDFFTQAGFEVLVFHATGTGGRTMESVIASGAVHGIFDVTTTEIADEIVGGVLGAGPGRLDAGATAGVPALIAPGCVDMVNFGPRETVPEAFAGRLLYAHNDQVTLLRTTPEENVAIAEFIARKLNGYRVRPIVALPLGGVSVLAAPGGPFHDPAADQALFATLKSRLHPDIPVLESPEPINHPDFAALCAESLLARIRNHEPR
ncbi:MAG: Tm-1-like ATP-binding domain-containing protein [Verrucomicrobia bacterium]|nr:Tm-1-like ATP-binding domain-containing protein [Verrucomicrobiota bacterium]